MSTVETWVAGVLRAQWDDDANPRTYTEWDATGKQTLVRPYTADENARADAELLAAAEAAAAVKFAADTEAVIRAIVATATPPADGLEWVQPTGYQNAYRQGSTCTHNGKTWKASRDGATGEPGVETADWVEVVPEGVIPEWVAPHAGQEYPPGAKVTHNGHLWRNDYALPNGWEPGVTGSQWTDLGTYP